ncbi:MAG: Methyltransferase type 11 [Actinomycetia bacterium]|nr:Methyltransferase type 11 [Actinomycetes bacterium]
MTSEHERHNRQFWDEDADEYQAAHGEQLAGAPLAWGAWRIPEDELGVLGDVAGLSVLEFGCGGAQWSVALAALGARSVGLDLSRAQLRHAQRNVSSAAVDVPLVQASGEAPPFADASFDIVFCDHGAMSFCDPQRTVPEAARMLRPGGLFAFCATTPLLYLTYDAARDRQTRQLQLRYDELGRMDYGDGTIDFVLPPGQWVRLLRSQGLEVEDLIELVAPEGATTSYTDFVPYRWASRWPSEHIWKTRKR